MSQQILTLSQASEIVRNSLQRGESYVMCDVFGNCEKLSPRKGGYFKGTYTADGKVTWADKPYKLLPQCYR